MSKVRDYRYKNKDGKLVAGPASVLHQIYGVKCGLQECVKAFIQQMSDEINDELEAEARRSQLKLVG